MNPITEQIVEAAKHQGWATVSRHILNDLFPHPASLSLKEVDRLIRDALERNIKPPPEQPTQAEQIQEFCDANDLIFQDRPENRDNVAFLCKGIPRSMKGVKKELQECAVGECVHELDVPEHARHSNVVKVAPPLKFDSSFYADMKANPMAAATLDVFTFQRTKLMNGENIFVRVS